MVMTKNVKSKPSPVLIEQSSIKRQRLARGVGLRELARRLEVTPGAVSQMERSEARGSIQLDTLRRALSAMGAELVTDIRRPQLPAEYVQAPFERREDRVAYELHRAIAKKLIDDPDRVRAVIPKNIEVMRENVHGRLVNEWLDRWQELSKAPVGVLVEALLATDELGKEMRQNGPFMGVLSEQERLEAIGRAAA
jgi:transcriptional regulator with XRE-family HTH domain